MQKLPLRLQIAYSCGMMGWSIMINLISVILVYLYLPPATSGLPSLITQVAVFGIFNVIALVTGGGRLVDAVYDPLLAQFSDTSKNPKGRRIPLMKLAILPSFIFCFLVFYPLKNSESTLNIYWLIFTLTFFYISSTTFIIPYNALLPELAHDSESKVKLATWQSVGYVFGIAIASNVFNITEMLEKATGLGKLHSLQLTVAMFAALGAVLMYITVSGINEKIYCKAVASSIPLKKALGQTLRNRNFLLFIVADFSFFLSVTLITAGLMYFVTVLLGLDESISNKLMITMVLVSFLFYPVTNWASRKIGKKKVVILSLILLGITFSGVFLLGKFPFPPKVQIFTLIIFAAIPVASLNILPNAILAEIIEKDSRETNENKEAIYFAVRYFFVKIAQTIGIALFSMFLLYGKDVGNDFGIRLNGVLGCSLCILAALVFTRFKEPEKKI
ncbi:MAG: MFS transporter [Bacteroidetes bacterium]|nr:MFS transporter [Bacteroidota bacterium]